MCMHIAKYSNFLCIHDINALNFTFQYSVIYLHILSLHLCLQLTNDIYCLIGCYGSQLRGYVSSVDAMKHLPGLLILAMEKSIQTMSLSMEREDLLDMSFLPAFSSCTIW